MKVAAGRFLHVPPGPHALAALLDEQTGRYRELNGARHLGEYLDPQEPARYACRLVIYCKIYQC